jgi:putative transcriptional regulator
MEEIKVSNNIRKLRFFNDEMSQQQLADLVGCSRQTIVTLEQDKYSPSLLLAAKIARVFKAKIEDVFTIEFL